MGIYPDATDRATLLTDYGTSDRRDTCLLWADTVPCEGRTKDGDYPFVTGIPDSRLA